MPLLQVKPETEEYNFLLVNPVEDMQRTRDLLRAAYPESLRIWEENTIERACELFQSTVFDFVVLDIAVDDYNEAEALEAIERVAAYSPLLVYTTVDDPDLAIRLIQAGAQDCLIKGRGNFYTLRRIISFSLERAKFHRQIQDSEQLLKRFIKHSPAATAMFDVDMRYLLCSDRWIKDFGLSNDIVGKLHYDVFSNISEEWKQCHKRCLDGEILKKEEDAYQLPNGKKEYFKWELVPWYRAGAVGGIIIFTEVITDIVVMQQSLEKANEQLEKSIRERTVELEKALVIAEESNRAKTDFFTNITHELRTPLHAILNFSDFAREKYETAPPEKVLGYIDKIHRSGQRLLNLVNDVLDLAKTKDMSTEIRPENILLHGVIKEAIDDLYSLSEKRDLTLAIEIFDEQAVCYADTSRLSQVIINLLSNAYKFTKPASTVTISVTDKVEDNALLISVSDQGIGIPPEELNSIFDEFSQSQKIQSGSFIQGTGLGLAICRQIIHAHGGKIWAENNHDEGATVRFTVPKEKGRTI